MVSKNEEHISPASDIPILVKVGKYFIHKQNVHSVTRFGKGCKIMLNTGDEVLVNLNYDKVCELVK